MPKIVTRQNAALLTIGLTVASTAGYVSKSEIEDQRARRYHPALHIQNFTSWSLVYKHAVSTTNALFLLQPFNASDRGPLDASPFGPGWKSPYHELWKNGTWSVTVKQPQLQVAREYTPLPPFPHPFFFVEDEADRDLLLQNGHRAVSHKLIETISSPIASPSILRFLIRKDGETSSYIHQRTVSDKNADPNSSIELRGPSRELQDHGLEEGQVEEIVFLAGGTGIAPAMQLAHGLLARKAASYENNICHWKSGLRASKMVRGSLLKEMDMDKAIHLHGNFTSLPPDGDEPRISILWANRSRQECNGGKSDASLQPASWSLRNLFFTSTTSPAPPKDGEVGTFNPIVTHLRSLQRSFAIISTLHLASTTEPDPADAKSTEVILDLPADKHGIRTQPNGRNLVSAVHALRSAAPAPAGPKLEVAYFVDEEGSFISKAHLKHVFTRTALPKYAATSGGADNDSNSKRRKKLVIVSGPDGFVEHFAGPRDIVNGRVVHGRVGGILGELKREGLLKGWEVVKL
ncbi:hypothetical protein BDZ85DRAFT_253323 [Elsinoe ampelina]|uniref:FAD-binding FR-type domain-containing protein n=1 Tax=Elsinoe ampelina TaxID=302913 RepID=A0A6A6FZ56_9PEZI|nr:hypothetical protein BDZ85DRAFT_253323 [Elsinoe ampelina]